MENLKSFWCCIFMWSATLPLAASAADYRAVPLPATGGTSAASAVEAGNITGISNAGFSGPSAMYWTQGGQHRTSLHPPGWYGSEARGLSGNQQVGFARQGMGGPDRALLWTGTSDSRIDLTPPGFVSALAMAAAPGQQVGFGEPEGAGYQHALLWCGTAESAIDLHPSDFNASRALATNGTHQGGYSTYLGWDRAMLWSGTADSAVNVHPDGWTHSRILGMSADQQVGYVRHEPLAQDIVHHAALWHGQTAGWIDLNPNGFVISEAVAAANGMQVGHGSTAGNSPHYMTRALLWTSGARSAVDLHTLLPPEFVGSKATGIDDEGRIVGLAYRGPYGAAYAVMWVPVPEPTGLSILVLGILPGLKRRRVTRA